MGADSNSVQASETRNQGHGENQRFSDERYQLWHRGSSHLPGVSDWRSFGGGQERRLREDRCREPATGSARARGGTAPSDGGMVSGSQKIPAWLLHHVSRSHTTGGSGM